MLRAALASLTMASPFDMCLISPPHLQVAALAELLLAKETINHDDIVATIGARPFAV